jgi:glycine cleavage system regulatory protein
MKNNTKNTIEIKKAAKIGGILILGIFILAIILKIMENGSGPIPLTNRQLMKSPQSIGLSGGGIMKEKMDTATSASAVPGLRSNNMETEKASFSAGGGASVDVPDKKVIKDGNITMKVDSAEKSADKIAQIAKDNGGDVFSSDFYQSGNNLRSGNIVVKVPVNNFDKTFQDLKGVAVLVIRESTSGTDVTMEYTDLQAQLKNSQAEEQAYVKLLDSAQKMDDILSITQQLSQVRGEIESLQGRIRFMNSQTDMASISISLTEDTNVTIADSWRPWQVVKESINALIKNIQEGISFLIRLVIEVVPMLILYGIIIFAFYRIGRVIYGKFRKKNTR